MTDPIARFRELHRSGCFVMPNPWDVGSAKFLQHCGFPALASSSAAAGFTRGMPDRVYGMPLEAVLAHLEDLVGATPLPVNADFQAGYAYDIDGLAANVTRCVHTGVAGLSIEDATGDSGAPLYARASAIQRIRTAREAIDGTGAHAVLTARCEAYLVRDPDPARTALDRLVAYADAGADCLFAPGVRDPDTIAAIVKAVAPKPVNVLIGWPTQELTVARLAELGVRRISVGSALARTAWAAFMRAARAIAETGRFDAFADAAPIAELDKLFALDASSRS
jgi:2-methylisocitrate lyase-like PEP mutase family enzyme